jgi:outer membrane protein
MVGGSLGFGSGSSETTVGTVTADGPKLSNFNISPNVGYFIMDNLAVGLRIGYATTKSTEKDVPAAGDETINKTSEFTVSPFARYYMEMGEKAGLFIDGSVDIGSGKGTNEVTSGGTTVTNELKMSTFGVNIRPGVYWFITDHIGLEGTFGSLGFNSYKDDDGGNPATENKSSSFGLNLNTGIAVGFNYYF